MWKVFAFDNHFEQPNNPVPTPERWDILKAVGYDKVSLSLNFSMPERVERMRRIPVDRKRTGLGIASAYTIIDLNNPFPDGLNVFDLIGFLQPGDTLELAMTAGWMQRRSDAQLDASAIKALEAILPRAEAAGLMVSLYHHYGFWMESIDDCVRIAKALNHGGLRVTFCQPHWYGLHCEGKAQTLEQAIDLCRPWLHIVNTCGSRPARGKEGWPLPMTIEPFGHGEFDQAHLFALLRAAGFNGDLGFQGYGIVGDPATILAGSMAAYRQLFAQPHDLPAGS